MEKYTITGMSCAACVGRVEKAVLGVEGVSLCQVNLLTNSMNVEGAASEGDIVEAVKNAGYGAKKEGNSHNSLQNGSDSLRDIETPRLLKRLIVSGVFLLALMYVSMGHNMLNFPLSSFFEGNYIAIAILQMTLASIILVINQKFFINGVKGIAKLSPNMDTLVALGSGASFIYSLCVLFAMTRENSAEILKELLHGLYFESSAMILVLITLGKMLEAYSKGKTTNALKGLMDLTPKSAIILVNGEEKVVPASEVKTGEIFVVKAGGSIPTDGEIIDGECSVDESSLNGESIPVDKARGDRVYASTINKSGYIVARATCESGETVLAKIIKTVSDSVSTKAPIARIADTVSGFFVPVVMLVALLTTIIWLLVGQEIGYALSRGICVLVISCPCALGLATPVAIMVGNGVGAKKGILFKNAQSLEVAGKADIVLLDKTGTITSGKPEVVDIIPFGDISENELLRYAYSLEYKSEHPLALAIVEKAKELGIEPLNTEDFKIYLGSGVGAKINGDSFLGGSYKHISAKTPLSSEQGEKYDELAKDGKTPLIFAKNDTVLGIIAVRDSIKNDSKEAIKALRDMGLYTVMLTGDNELSANAIGNEVGVDKIIAGVMPNEKEKVVSDFKKQGKVIMVGDGINDAPALASADIGIAIGGGTDIAIDTAEVVLVKGSLSGVSSAIKLSRASIRNIKQNLFWAFIYNLIGIPLAAGAFVSLFGWELSPMIGALAMSLSSFCVVTNALRLNFFNEKRAYKRKSKINIIEKEEQTKMEITLKVEGMMCPHCEARVNKALLALDGVESAQASHESSSVKITLNKEVDTQALISTIEEQGYTVK